MPAKTPAKVTLSAKTVARIEDTLRDALVNAGTTNICDDCEVKVPKKKAKTKVALDPATLARFTEHLRRGLVNSESTNIVQVNAADAATVGIRSTRKKR